MSAFFEKLKRFVPGKTLSEQLTASRLNALVDTIERNQLQQGRGYLITKTNSGTVLNIDPAKNASRPKLWDVTLENVELNPLTIMAQVLEDTLSSWESAIPSEGDFDGVISPIFTGLDRNGTPPSSIKASIEALFASLQSIIDGFSTSVDTILNNINPISSALSTFFENLETFPSDGDYIYNNALGIGYTVFEKNEVRPAGTANPSGNLIFRVTFSVTLNEGQSNEITREFCAITLFPTPDIGRLISALLDYLLRFVKSVLSAGISSLVNNVVTGIVNSLSALYTEILGLIDAIPEFDPTSLWNSIGSLDDALTALTDRVDAVELAQDALQTALDALQSVIDGSVNVTVIGADGNYHTLKVQEDITGTSAEREITWIDSDTGYGRKASFLIKQGAAAPVGNIQDVDWRKVDYVHPDGTTYTMHCLVRVANSVSGFGGYQGSEPIDTADWPNYTLTDVVISDCAAGTSSTQKALLRS